MNARRKKESFTFATDILVHKESMIHTTTTTASSRKRGSNLSRSGSNATDESVSEIEALLAPLTAAAATTTVSYLPTGTRSNSTPMNQNSISTTTSTMTQQVSSNTTPSFGGISTAPLLRNTNSSKDRNHPRSQRNATVWSTISTSLWSSTHSIKLMVLIVLSLQNSLFTVLRRYSQGIRKETYSKYEVLMVGEIIKLLFSAYMIHGTIIISVVKGNTTSTTTPATTITNVSTSDDPTNESLMKRLLYLTNNSGKMIGLALIYGVMNILSFVALRNIGAGTFTIFAQCKILTTAAFSALLLQRQYSITKWRALLALVLGVLLFSEPIWNKPTISSVDDTTTKTPTKESGAMVVVGIVAVLIEVILSGFASIYFEKVIKLDPLPLTIWERNFQLALVRNVEML
jgi:Nucleotide-sugar transporter